MFTTRISRLVTLLTLFCALQSNRSAAICTWSTYFFDDYEYTSVCPDILPGKVYHNTPMAFRPHAGNLSLYFNFRDTVCLAGDMVYRRYLEVCPNLPVRISSWICTAFQSPNCDIRVRIADGNNTTLDDQLSVQAPLYPSWTQYVSAPVISTTGSVYIEIYTNIPGQSGNDLAWDELRVEYCSNYNAPVVSSTVCSGGTPVSLYALINPAPLQTGSWLTSQPLNGGYLGMYDPAVNSSGIFVYSSNSYGLPPLCPQRRDTLLITETPSPSSSLVSDTTLCTGQDITLTPGPAFSSYLWSDGSTSSSLLVPAPGGTASSAQYYVTLSGPSGCLFTDSTFIQYVVCSSINDPETGAFGSVYPNPTTGRVVIRRDDSSKAAVSFVLTDVSGRVVFTVSTVDPGHLITLPSGLNGIYYYQLLTPEKSLSSGKLIVQ